MTLLVKLKIELKRIREHNLLFNFFLYNILSSSITDPSSFPSVKLYLIQEGSEVDCSICLQKIKHPEKTLTTSCGCVGLDVIHRGCFTRWARDNHYVDEESRKIYLRCLSNTHWLQPGDIQNKLPTYELPPGMRESLLRQRQHRDETDDASSTTSSYHTACSSVQKSSKVSDAGSLFDLQFHGDYLPFRSSSPSQTGPKRVQLPVHCRLIVREFANAGVFNQKINELGEMLQNFGTNKPPPWLVRKRDEMYLRFGAAPGNLAEWKLREHTRVEVRFGEEDGGTGSVLIGLEEESNASTGESNLSIFNLGLKEKLNPDEDDSLIDLESSNGESLYNLGVSGDYLLSFGKETEH